MDRTRFDGITRALAAGQSRRSILKLLGGGVVAGAATTVASKITIAQTCYTSGACPPYECCTGYACVDGQCVEEMVEETPTDTTTDTGTVAMPETGVGGSGGDGAQFAGVALAGGVAALLASKYLRPSDPATERD